MEDNSEVMRAATPLIKSAYSRSIFRFNSESVDRLMDATASSLWKMGAAMQIRCFVAVIHRNAFAGRLGIPLELDLFQHMSSQVPLAHSRQKLSGGDGGDD